jgi:hypothetical protein
MSWRWSRLWGIALTSALAVSCSKGGSGTETEGRLPGHVSDSTSSSDVDAGVGSLAAGKRVDRAFGARRESVTQRVTKELLTKLRGELIAGRSQEVIVQLARLEVAPNQLEAARRKQRSGLLTRVGNGIAVKQTFDQFGYALLHVKSVQALDSLLAQGEIKRIVANKTFSPLSTTTAATFIGQASAATTIGYDPDSDGNTIEHLGSSGAEGAVGIALLDGKADQTHASVGTLADYVDAQRTCTAGPPDKLGDICSDAADCGDGGACAPESTNPAENHATVMAGILRAVAPAATIHNVDITGDSGSATTASILKGLEYVASLPRGTVSAVSLSFGDNASYANVEECESDVGIESAIDDLLDLDVVTFVASGNGGSTTGLSAPACLGNVVSVGAVQGKTASSVPLTKVLWTDANNDGIAGTGETATSTCSQTSNSTATNTGTDKPLCNSNTSLDLDLLAPGLTVDIDTEVNDHVCVGGAAAGRLCSVATASNCVLDLVCNTTLGKCATAATGTPTYVSNTDCTSANAATVCTTNGACTDVDGFCANSTSNGRACLDATHCPGTGATCTQTLPPQSGTSVATAHAAAAFAVVLADNRHPTQGVARALSRLKAGGVNIVDARNTTFSTPRVSLPGAIADCAGPVLGEDVAGSCQLTCVGGDKAGQDCSSDSECAAETGDCTADKCVGGPWDTKACTSPTDCAGIGGVCGTATAGTCDAASAQPGASCTADAQCTGGTCEGEGKQGTCADGLFAGESCSSGSTECDGTDDGDSVTVSAAGTPAVDVDVNTDSSCLAGGFCENGPLAGEGCEATTDCHVAAGTCSKTCVGGFNGGALCTADADCQDGVDDGTCTSTAFACNGGAAPGAVCTTLGAGDSACAGSTVGTCSGLETSESWLHASFVNNVVSISADANTGEERIGTVMAFGKGISVTQSGGSAAAPTGGSLSIVESYSALCSAVGVNAGDPCNSSTASTDCPGSQATCSVGTKWVNPGADGKPSFDISASGATEYCMINDNDDIEDSCPGDVWNSIVSRVNDWALAAGSPKVVKVWFRNADGAVSEMSKLVFSTDSAAPGAGLLATTVASGSIKLAVNGAPDNASGVNRLRVARSSSAISSCSGGTLVQWDGVTAIEDPNTPAVANGTTYHYCACRVDAAGNESAAACTSSGLTPKDDNYAPRVTSIAFGSALYNSTTASTASVTITGAADGKLTALGTDGANPPEICTSYTDFAGDYSGCTWADATGSISAPLSTGTEGVRTLYWVLRDEATDGASNSMPNYTTGTATTRFDSVVPANGTVSAVFQNNFDAKLTIGGITDTGGSGVASLAIRYGSAAVADCSAGTGLGRCINSTNNGTVCDATTDCLGTDVAKECELDWPANTTSVIDITAPSTIATRYYRVCATDVAGNTNTGAAPAAGVALKGDTSAPTVGTVTVAPTCSSTTGCYAKVVSGVTYKFNKSRSATPTGTSTALTGVRPPIQVTLSDAWLVAGSARAKICFATTASISGCATSDWITVTGTPTGAGGTSAIQTISNQTYVPVRALAAGTATRSYYLFTQDPFGNKSTTYKKIDVKVDTNAPTLSTFTAAKSASGTVKLTWTKAADGSLGVGVTTATPFVVKFLKGTTTAAPTTTFNCTTGGTAITFTQTPSTVTVTKSGLVNGSYYKFLICAKDFLGHQSAAKTVTYKIPL